MTTNFPDAIDGYTDPVGPQTLATNHHKQRHIDLQDAMVAVQTTLGVSGSADPNSIEYRVTQASAAASGTASALAQHAAAAAPHSGHATPASVAAAVAAHEQSRESHPSFARDGFAHAGKNAGVVINPLTSASGIAFSGTTGATGGVDQTFPGLDGENTLWIECPIASGGVGFARAILTQNHRFSAADSVSVRVKVEKASTLRFIQLQVVQGAVVLSNSTTSDGTAEAGEWGWYTLTWRLSDFTVSGGTPDYGADFTSYRFQIGAGGSGGALGKIAFSRFMKNARSNAYLLVANDSAYADIWGVRDVFRMTGVPLNIYTRASVLGANGFLSGEQIVHLKDDPTGVFCIGSYPDYMPALSHTATGVCAAQSVAGAGNLLINGTLASAGTASFSGVPRKLVLSGSAVSRTIMFTVVGSLSGQAVTEVMLGPAYANGKVESAQYYDTITQISVSAAVSGTVTVGTAYSTNELTDNFETNAAALRVLGLGGSEQHVAYPGGEISGSLAAAVAAFGADSGRTTYALQQQPRNMLLHDAAFQSCLLSGLNLSTPIATLKARVDDLVDRGGIIVFYFHKIAETVDGINPTAEHLAEFVAYVQSAQQQGKLRALDFVGLKWLLQNRPAA